MDEINDDVDTPENVEPALDDNGDIDDDDVCIDDEDPIIEFVELIAFELAELWAVWVADEVNDEIMLLSELLCDVVTALVAAFDDEVSGCTLETTCEVVADGLIVNVGVV